MRASLSVGGRSLGKTGVCVCVYRTRGCSSRKLGQYYCIHHTALAGFPGHVAKFWKGNVSNAFALWNFEVSSPSPPPPPARLRRHEKVVDVWKCMAFLVGGGAPRRVPTAKGYLHMYIQPCPGSAPPPRPTPRAPSEKTVAIDLNVSATAQRATAVVLI